MLRQLMLNASPQPDVPVLVETPGRPVFPMVRCHYMSVECDDLLPGWSLGVNGTQMPFLMLNLVGIVQQPFGAARFDNYNVIDQFFRGIEQQMLSINFEDVWLPSFLFHGEPRVGDIYRVGVKLFVAAFQFRAGRYTQETFEDLCKELQREIVPSNEETLAFRGWTAEQISTAQNGPPKNPEFRLQTKSI